MDRVANPYAPGAGSPPPELAGREAVLDDAQVALARQRIGRPSKGIILIGLRGAGKTVLLNRIQADAARSGIAAIAVESPEQRSLPSLLAPALRVALLRLSRKSAARAVANRALRALSGFVSALRVRYDDLEISLDLEAEPGLADHGDLDADLPDLLEAVGHAAQAAGTCAALFLDELQYVDQRELGALLTALHRTAQQSLPVALIGAGLPQARAQVGQARTYAERQFDFIEIGSLSTAAAREAIAKPAEAEGVRIDDNALDAIVEQTQGYPYFLQEWGKHAWDVSKGRRIRLADVRQGAARAIEELDQSFFRVRLDRVPPGEYRYMRAMAELGPGPHRSGDIAVAMGRQASEVAAVRNRLINKGMVWSPSHGVTAFTVPLFDEFMKRTMPEWE